MSCKCVLTKASRDLKVNNVRFLLLVDFENLVFKSDVTGVI